MELTENIESSVNPSSAVSDLTTNSVIPRSTETSISKLHTDLSALVDTKEPFFVLLFQKGTHAGSIKASIINDKMTPIESIAFQKTNETPLEEAITKYISPGLKEFYNTVSDSPRGGSRKHRRRHRKKNKTTKRRSRK